jgi:hypothetical protein
MAVKEQPPRQITLAVSRAEPAQAARSRIRSLVKNRDLITTCAFAVIGVLVSLSLGLAFPLTEDAVTMLAQFP